MWHVTCGGGWTFTQHFPSSYDLGETVFLRNFHKLLLSELLNESVTKLFVEWPNYTGSVKQIVSRSLDWPLGSPKGLIHMLPGETMERGCRSVCTFVLSIPEMFKQEVQLRKKAASTASALKFASSPGQGCIFPKRAWCERPWGMNMQFTFYTEHFTLFTVQSTIYTLHYTLYTVQFTLHCTIHNVHCTLYTVHYTVYSVHCTLYTVNCTLHCAHCTLYCIHSTMHTENCTMYTEPYEVQYRGMLSVACDPPHTST